MKHPLLSAEQAADAIFKGRGRGVRIAVLDTGIETSHPELANVQWSDDIAIVEEDFRLLSIPGNGLDLFGHGTAVAGIIHRMAPEAEIGSFRVLGSSVDAKTTVVLQGARMAIERGYNIINCSLGCTIVDHVLRYKHWVDEAYLRGVHVVAACNNHDYSRQEWPAFFSSVIAVNMARTERDGVIYYKPGSLVEFAAQGVDVEVPWKDGTSKRVTGSSFAAPKVAGMLACLLSETPGLPPLEAKAVLHRLAQPWTRDLLAPNERQ